MVFAAPPSAGAASRSITIGKSRLKGSGHRVIGYVLHIRRKHASRLVHLSSPSTFLDGVKGAISKLAAGDETSKDFLKTPKKPKAKAKKKEEKKAPVITKK
jgi:hypothetical protein